MKTPERAELKALLIDLGIAPKHVDGAIDLLERRIREASEEVFKKYERYINERIYPKR